MSRVKVSNSGQSHCCAVPLKQVEHYSLFKDFIAFNAKFIFFFCSKFLEATKFLAFVSISCIAFVRVLNFI